VSVQQETSLNNAAKVDSLARRAIGLPEDAPLTPQATQAVRKEAFQQGYAPLENAGQISTGKLYRQDLDNIVQQYQGAARSFPQAVRDDVGKMVDGLRRRSFDAGDAVKMSATLREGASKSFSTGDSALGKAQRAAADAIENQIERGLGSNPKTAEMMQNFRDARKLMAKSHTVEGCFLLYRHLPCDCFKRPIRKARIDRAGGGLEALSDGIGKGAILRQISGALSLCFCNLPVCVILNWARLNNLINNSRCQQASDNGRLIASGSLLCPLRSHARYTACKHLFGRCGRPHNAPARSDSASGIAARVQNTRGSIFRVLVVDG
jgi:hypothetical protein